MNFNDLIFKPHPVKGVKGIHATLELKPNIHMSIVAGEGMYCTTKNGIKKAVSKVEDVVSFEVAIIDENVNEECIKFFFESIFLLNSYNRRRIQTLLYLIMVT